jgi:hypothetical protein
MNSKWIVGGLGIIVCVAITSGCVSVEEQRWSMVNYCDKLGLKRDSPEFSDCLARLNQQIGVSEQCLSDLRYGIPYNYGKCMSRRFR